MKQQERQERSRREIFQAAMEEFGAHGYDKVSMENLCTRHGISKGMMYHYYSNKDELFLLCVQDVFQNLKAQIEQEIVQLGENLWRVAGTAELKELSETLDIELPEDEEYDTLGGLIFAQLSVIPEDGSQIELDVCGLHIRVTELAERRVEWALVSKLPPEEENKKESGS